MDKNGWGNPNSFTLAFRCTNRKYAKSFFEYGEMKFSTPKSWVEYALNNSIGRGDPHEGTIAYYDVGDINKMIELNNKYNNYRDLIRVKVNNRIYLKRATSMNLPCFCFYTLKTSMFDCPVESGIHELETTIPASYFRDFSDHKSISQVENMESDDQPAVIYIENFDEFIDKIINKLLSIGLNHDEIIVTNIRYVDFNQYGPTGWVDTNTVSPNELTIKDIRFIEQSEVRIIINTSNKKVLKRLENPIRIGNLDGIVQVVNRYLYDGMQVKLKANIEWR